MMTTMPRRRAAIVVPMFRRDDSLEDANVLHVRHLVCGRRDRERRGGYSRWRDRRCADDGNGANKR
jgi:hypothetical protein